MGTLRRLLQIYWAIGGHLVWWGLVYSHLLRPSISPAQRLCKVLEKLGTTFVKLGQGLSLRQDILPDDYVEALQSLQDHVQAFDSKIARREIEQALGDSIENLFAEFDDTPLAAASIAQVHKATLPDGRRVIIKVRRPDLRNQVTQDIRLLKLVLRVVLALVPQLQKYSLPEIVRENGLTLIKEIDFRQEMRNTHRFREAFKDSSTVHIPAAIPELCTESVMVQEMSGGRLVTDPSVQKDGPQLAINFADAYLHQFFIMGCIHADPHPGNLFIMDNGKICFHDFGMVGLIDITTRRKLAGFFLALINQDSEWLLDSYLDLGLLGEEVDRQQVQRGMNELIQEYASVSLQEWSLATAMLSAARMGWGFNLRMPYHLLLVMRALLIMESTLRSLDPQFNMASYWQSKGATLMTTALKESAGGSNSARLKYEASVFAQELPKALARFLRSSRSGKFEIPLHHRGLRDFENHVDRSSNRIALALVALGLYIASSLLAQSELKPVIAGIPLIALGGYTLALWVTFRLLRGISHSGRV